MQNLEPIKSYWPVHEIRTGIEHKVTVFKKADLGIDKSAISLIIRA